MSADQTVHGVCLVIGELGILIRGASGAGKSVLALALVESARARGAFARLVADDRVRLARRHGRLVARPHPAIAGRMELRHTGIVAVDHEAAAVLGLIVDLEAGPLERLPAASDLVVDIAGIRLPRLVLAAASGSFAVEMVEAGMAFLRANGGLAGLAPNSP